MVADSRCVIKSKSIDLIFDLLIEVSVLRRVRSVSLFILPIGLRVIQVNRKISLKDPKENIQKSVTNMLNTIPAQN